MTAADTRKIVIKTKATAARAFEFVWKGLFDSKLKRAVEPGKFEEIERTNPYTRTYDKYIC